MGTTMQETPQTNGQRKLRYIELFAGIGGFGLALNRLGHTCVWANEWDKYAGQIYNRNFKSGEFIQGTERGSIQYEGNQSNSQVGGDGQPKTWGDREFQQSQDIDTRDIRTVLTSEIPDHDLLVGGFPCQAFSIAGKRRGFDDTRGTMFFEIARILKDKQPKFFILENVKGLLSHDNGNTFKTIISTLTELGYDLQWQVLNSKNFGVPQNRERVFIVGHLRGQPRPEVFPIGKQDQVDIKREKYAKKQIASCLQSGEGSHIANGEYKGMNVVETNSKIRRLTPLECERLQGFPDGWTEGISDTQRYKCLGNAVTVNVVYEIAKRLEKSH